MKKFLPLMLICHCVISININAQTIDKSCYVDFGPTEGTNGAITDSPDVNGIYWNNATSGSANDSISLIDSAGAATTLLMKVTDAFVVNTSINYGPTVTASENLGYFSISTATQDYFYLESSNSTGQLTFYNLDPDKAYKFEIFASRPTTSTRITKFNINGLSSYSDSIETSDGSDGNLTDILESSLIFPDDDGVITIDVGIVSGSYGYINCLKILEYNDVSLVDVTEINVTGGDIDENGGTSQFSAEVLPVNATSDDVVWSVSDSSVGIISQTGLLSPVSNGTVTVTATSVQNYEVSGSKEVNISNQITELYLSGSATENGIDPKTAIPMHMVTGLDNLVTSKFEIYTSLIDTGSIYFYTSASSEANYYGKGSEDGTIEINSSGINTGVSGPVLISVDLSSLSYTITEMSWSVVGSTITDSWSGDEPLEYIGGGIWSDTIDMNVVNSDTDPRFVFRANQNWSYSIKQIEGTENSVIMESTADELGINVEDIDLTYGVFIVTLDLSDYTYTIQCNDIDEYKITFIGSSVCNGQGASDMEGYSFMYDSLLQNRADSGSSPFYRSNQCVNGNNTINVLDRYNSDLLGDCGRYVVFGLSLGNEGVVDEGKEAFDQFEENMLLLIKNAEEDGKIPVVMNNYTRADFDETDYAFVKAMNMKIAQWDVPSCNTLGAVDNGSGNWATGYQDDVYHPNDEGHAEMFYTMVPSLFDAIEADKGQPEFYGSTYLTPDSSSNVQELTFTPEGTLHPFTVSFDIKTESYGEMMVISNSADTARVSLDADGFVTYTSPKGAKITGDVVLNDGEWHRITLTHYYAWGVTMLYQDDEVIDTLSEKVEAKSFSLLGTASLFDISYRNWFFYRSGMNKLEISALNDNTMLKSSLELYAPLDQLGVIGDDPFVNLAQSINAISVKHIKDTDGGGNTSGIQNFNSEGNIIVAPNPVKDVLNVFVNDGKLIKSDIYKINGGLVMSEADQSIPMADLSNGIYAVKVYTSLGVSIFKIVKN